MWIVMTRILSMSGTIQLTLMSLIEFNGVSDMSVVIQLTLCAIEFICHLCSLTESAQHLSDSIYMLSKYGLIESTSNVQHACDVIQLTLMHLAVFMSNASNSACSIAFA